MPSQRWRGAKSTSRNRLAFTLIELLVVIAIIAILIALLVPAVQKVREAAARATCLNNLKQLALACHSYHDVNKRFPPGAGRVGGGSGLSPNTDNGSWIVYLLPYIEQAGLAQQIDAAPGPAGRRIKNAYDAKILPVPLAILRCPSDDFDPRAAVSNYVASIGPQCCPGQCGAANSPYRIYCNGNSFAPPWGYPSSTNYGDTTDSAQARGMFTRQGATVRMIMVTDGTSSTILFGELLAGQNGDVLYSIGVNPITDGFKAGWARSDSGLSMGTTTVFINHRTDYMDPGGNGCVNPLRNVDNYNITFGFKSRHSGGANFAFADGSIQFISQAIDHRVYNQLGCRNDDQVASVP
jgi:prepilin-type N-terminal cleavage/methylation domain-containing protein/prepilin-type processing-associated H-X9-DG protein